MASCTAGQAKHDRRDSHGRPCRTASLTGTGRGDTQVGLARLARFNMLNSAKAEFSAKHGGWGCGPMSERVARHKSFRFRILGRLFHETTQIEAALERRQTTGRHPSTFPPSELKHRVRYDSDLGNDGLVHDKELSRS